MTNAHRYARAASWVALPLLVCVAQIVKAEVVVQCNLTYTSGPTAAACSTAVSSASGNLSTGQARAVSSSVSWPPQINVAADVYLRDTITVVGPWSSSSITALLSMDVTGTVTGTPLGQFQGSSLWSSNAGGVGTSLAFFGDGSGGYSLTQNDFALGSVSIYGTTTVHSSALNAVSYRLEIPVVLTSSSASFYFQSLLRAYPYGAPATVDFGHTGQMSLALPEGYSFTSASGVFLSEAPAVPLPAAAWLFASGILALGQLGRRRKRFNTIQ